MLSIIMFSIMILSIMTLSVMLLSLFTLILMKLNIITYSVTILSIMTLCTTTIYIVAMHSGKKILLSVFSRSKAKKEKFNPIFRNKLNTSQRSTAQLRLLSPVSHFPFLSIANAPSSNLLRLQQLPEQENKKT